MLVYTYYDALCNEGGKLDFEDSKCKIWHFKTSRAMRETYITNLRSFQAKTTKLWRFYGSREKDKITENGNREKDKEGMAPIL